MSMFILRYKEKKVEMDPIFEHPVFDSEREKTRCTLVSNVGATRYFPSQNRLGLVMRERLYSMSVVIVTINGGMDDNVN